MESLSVALICLSMILDACLESLIVASLRPGQHFPTEAQRALKRLLRPLSPEGMFCYLSRDVWCNFGIFGQNLLSINVSIVQAKVKLRIRVNKA